MIYTQAEIEQAYEIIAFVSEKSRAERREAYKATARQRRDDWLTHAEGCERRYIEYLKWAYEYPASHRLRKQYIASALEQHRKAQEARRQASMEGKEL